MNNRFSENEINTILDTLMTGDIADNGLGTAGSSSNMKQKDIDLLVNLIQELQKYRDIGTPEECAQYKKIAQSK